MGNPYFQVAIRFISLVEFKTTIQNYSIANGRLVWYYTNEEFRVRVRCKDPCNWEFYTSQEKAPGPNDFVV